MTVRDALITDAEAIAVLSGQLGYPAETAELRARLETLLGRSSHHAVFVATDEGGRVIGWVHIGRRDVLENAACAEILGLVVDTTLRGAGIGRALVAGAEAWARARGLGEVVVRSNIARLESHPFYERLGYRRTKTQHVYRRALG